MESKKSILIWLTVMCFMLSACGKQELTTSSDASTSSSGLTVTTYSSYESVSEYTEEKSCSASGTVASPVSTTCSVSIPELRLFYSKLKFTVTHEGSDCSIVNFVPYAYRRSLSAAYTPVGASAAINCSNPSSSTDPVACWGGPAKVLVTGYYYRYTGLYSTSSDAWDITIDSPNSKTDGDRSLRWITNDLASAERTTDIAMGGTTVAGATIADGYEYDAAYTTYQDYKFKCYDEYGNLTSTITLTINDDEGSTPTTNDVESWN